MASNSDPTPAAMHGQLMDSPGHHANILGDYTHLGVGYAVDDDGGGWLVEVFASYPDAMPGDDGPAEPTPSEAPSSETPTEDPPTTAPSPEAPTTQDRALPAGWLGLGSSGVEVLALQEDLAALGYDVVPDGDFGEVTLGEVARFQETSGLQADGLVGPQTLAAVDDALAELSPEPSPEVSAELTTAPEKSSDTSTPAPSWPGTATPDIVPTGAEPPASGGSLGRMLTTPALVGILGGASAAFTGLVLLRRRIRASH